MAASKESLGCQGSDKLRAKLDKKFCKMFQPHRDYLTHHFKYIVEPKLESPIPCHPLRNNLQLSRQLMHAREVIQEHFPHQLLRQLLQEEPPSQPMHIQRNKMLYIQGTLYFACNHTAGTVRSQLKALPVREVLMEGAETAMPSILAAFEQPVLELAQAGRQILIRLPKKLHLYHIETASTTVHSFSHEITAVSVYPPCSAHPSIKVSTHDGLATAQIYTIAQRSPVEQFGAVLVHSLFHINASTLVAASRSELSIRDLRADGSHPTRILPSDYFHAAIPLNSHYISSQLVATSQSTHISIYDLRKISAQGQPIMKIPHFCQESPPTILQYFDGETTPSQLQFPDPSLSTYIKSLLQREPNCYISAPVLLAHSPYKLGSTLFAAIKPAADCQPKFELLFDSGKVDQNCHPDSVCAIPHHSKRLALLHLDNLQGLALQQMQLDPVALQYRHCPNAQHTPKEIDLNYEWFVRYQMQKCIQLPTAMQLESDCCEDESSQLSGLSLESVDLLQPKARYANLKDFYLKLHEQQSQPQQSQPQQSQLQQSQLQQSRPSQQQDSLECQSFRPTQQKSDGQQQSHQSNAVIRASQQVHPQQSICTESILSQLIQEWSA